MQNVHEYLLPEMPECGILIVYLKIRIRYFAIQIKQKNIRVLTAFLLLR